MRAYPAIKVTDRVAYDYRGERIAPVVAVDGYYPEISRVGISNGLLMEGVPAIEISPRRQLTQWRTCITVSDYPNMIDVRNGENVDIGEIDPPLPVGTTLDIFYGDNNGYSYRIAVDSFDLIGTISTWWKRYPYDSPWIEIEGKSRLNPARLAWIEMYKSKAMTAILGDEFSDFMRQPTQMSQLVAKNVARKLALIRAKLNRELAPIGGKITSIAPWWQKHIALCHLKFEINGVDPTRGQGCMVYLNGDFYYGPWCERVEQLDISHGLLHRFPPKYTLKSWIVGPLLASVTHDNYTDPEKHRFQSHVSGSKPAPFFPTGAVILAAGTQNKRDSDGLNTGHTPEQLMKAIEELANQYRAKADKVIVEKLVILFNKLKFETSTTEGRPSYRISLSDIYRPYPVHQISILSDDGENWYYRVSLYDPRGTYAKDTELLFPFEIEIKLQSGPVVWGAYVTDIPASINNEVRLEHNQIPMFGCSCDNCRFIRAYVSDGLKRYVAGKSAEQTLNNLEAEFKKIKGRSSWISV